MPMICTSRPQPYPGAAIWAMTEFRPPHSTSAPTRISHVRASRRATGDGGAAGHSACPRVMPFGWHQARPHSTAGQAPPRRRLGGGKAGVGATQGATRGCKQHRLLHGKVARASTQHRHGYTAAGTSLVVLRVGRLEGGGDGGEGWYGGVGERERARGYASYVPWRWC